MIGQIFSDEFLDGFGSWSLAYIPYGGADFGEVVAVARAVGDGDESHFYREWTTAADRLADSARSADEAGHTETARDLYLRASVFYGTAYRPLFGDPVDARLVEAAGKQASALRDALMMGPTPAQQLNIAFENITLPGYFIPANGRASERRPLIIFTNGYDGTMTDMHFASVVAATARGYHCVIFDGPGQGSVLVEQGVHLRPDWESVIGAVLDAVQGHPLVDADRIVLSGWSLGGHLALRAASVEHRLAACISDPPVWCVADGFAGYAAKLGATPEQAQHLGDLDQQVIDRAWEVIQSQRQLYWSVGQRGFWVNGVDNLCDYFRSIETFTLEGRVEDIACPTLLTYGEADALGANSQRVFDALTCPKQMMRFMSADGAGDHCEMMNRSILNRKTLDWLDDLFANAAPAAPAENG